MTPTARKVFLASEPPSPDDERRFFVSIRTRDGVFKTTDSDRMLDVNNLVARWCKRRALYSPTVLDVAASSGVSTADLARDLLREGIKAEPTATDILLKASIVRLLPGIYALQDEKNRVLQHEIFGMAILPHYTRNPLRSVGTYLANSVYKTISMRRQPELVAEVKLTSRVAGGIQVIQDNLFEHNADLDGRFDIVRAANVLNVGYFDAASIKAAIQVLARYLRGPGSLLVVNRTLESGVNHGSLFELTDSGAFSVTDRVGEGSEVEALVRMHAR